MQIKLASGLGGLIVPHRANTSCTIIIPTIKVNSQIILFVFLPFSIAESAVTAVTVQTMPVFDGNKA